jgi:ribonuclease T
LEKHSKQNLAKLANRFRGFLPVVVDVETGGFNFDTDALLEIAAVMLVMDDNGNLHRGETYHCHILPFPGSNMEPESLQVTQIDPYHPFRFAVSECEGLEQIFKPIRNAVKQAKCERAVLVGHNAHFDLSFIQAACKRCQIKKQNPFHSFTVFDTATLSALIFGETVLVKAMNAAGIEFDRNQAHSAIYDAEKTADLFCQIFNHWQDLKATRTLKQNKNL